MLEAYAVGVTLDLKGNVLVGIEKIMAQMDALDRRVKDVNSNFSKMATDLRGLGAAGRSIGQLDRALDRLSSRGAGKAVTDFEKMAAATRSMVAANERLTSVMAENARLAADSARAMEGAARATRQQPAARANRSSNSSRLTSHDGMMLAAGGVAVGSPIVHGGAGALDRGLTMAHWRTALMSDDRVSAPMADAAVNRAYEASQLAPGSTPLNNMASFAKLKTITGSFDESMAMLPDYARLMTLLATIDRAHGSKGHGGDQGYAAAKAAEILGMMTEDRLDPATGKITQHFDPKLLNTAVDRFGRIASAELGNVMPTDILALAKQGTTAGMVMSPEFMWEKLPSLVQVWGGSRTGTALQSLVQVFGPGGKLEPKVFDNLAKLGLADPAGHRRERVRDPLTGRMRTRESIDPTKIKNYELLLTDPAEWAHKASIAMDANGIHGSRDQALNIMAGAQRSTIARLFADLIKDYEPILKGQQNIQHQRPNLPEYYAQNDPTAKLMQVQASWDKMMTAFGSASTMDAVRVMDAVTAGLNFLGDFAKNNPTTARVLTDTAIALGALAAGLGTLSGAILLFGPAMKLLGGGAAASATAGAAGVAAGGGALGLASRLALGGPVLGAGGAILGGIAVAHENMAPLTEGQARRHAPWLAAPQDGFGVDGRPVQMHGTVNLDGKAVGTFVGNSIARGATGASTGQTGYDIRTAPVGGMGGAAP